MKKDMIFFTADKQYEGLKMTSTSANTIANWTKEYYQGLEIALNSMQFFTKTVGLIGQSETSVLSEGMESLEFAQVPNAIHQIAECKSLIAWLREAIKAKENLNKEVLKLNVEDYCRAHNIEVPTMPSEPDVLTEDEYWSSKSIKERNAYYELETKAAVLGKYIHNGGSFAKAREEMRRVANKPHEIIGSGRDATIYNYSITISPSEVDDTFFALQQKHREYQASLNALKFECEKAIEESRMKANNLYSEAMMDYRTAMNLLQADTIKWKQEQQLAISELKIILPDSLKDIYNTVVALGKKKKNN